VRIVRGTVTPAPTLTAQTAAASTFRIAWPTAAASFKLQSATSLTGTWSDVTTPIVLDGTDNVITEPVGTGNKFYRLIQTP